jgi:hypothetical protein
MCTTVYLWCHNHLFLYSTWVHGWNNFCVACIWFKIVWSYWLYYSCFLSINWLSASFTPTITVAPDWFWIRLSLQWLISVKLNRPPKPEESQKDSYFNGKTIPYPGFEPGTSGLAVGSHNHCTIWVGNPRPLVAGAFKISYTKCHKRGLLEKFWGPFVCMVAFDHSQFDLCPRHHSLLSQELPSTQIRWWIRNSCCHSLFGVDNPSISSPNQVFCLFFVDLQPCFCCFCIQC